MGRFKSIHIEFEGVPQRIEELIGRARLYAQTNRAYSLEIILHLQDHAYQTSDPELFRVCRELMVAVQSPSPYPTKLGQQYAGDENNRPRTIDPAVSDIDYDDSFDFIFDERVKAIEVRKALDKLTFRKTGRVEWFVVYKVLLHLKWLKENCTQKNFLGWVNLQYQCGWKEEYHFVFSKDVHKTLRDKDISCWNTIDYNEYTKGEKYYNFAVLLRNTFEYVIVNGFALKEPAKDFLVGQNRDRNDYMHNPAKLINWGK